ncbi:hypothetical protein DFQ28_001981, partial [Apophysomyces sp. BC1034]
MANILAELPSPPPPDVHPIDLVLNSLPTSVRSFDETDTQLWRHLLFALRKIDRCTATSDFAPEPSPGSILVEM